MTELKFSSKSTFLLAVAGLALLAATCDGGGSTGTAVPSVGGAPSASTVPTRLIATSRTEPKSFNRLVSPFAAEELFARLTQATLLRVNHLTGQLEPWLATSWTGSDDGKTWTLKLRRDVTFSDGAAFSSADVQFTFDALFDKRVASELATSLLVGGQPIVARATSADTVILTFAASYGPGLSLLDAIPILPRHKLEAALSAGKFREAWSTTTPPVEIVGLGPFVLKEYVPGQRLLFARNPRYWRKDESGAALPRLSEIEVQIVPDQNAELLRLTSGTSDLTNSQVRAEDLAPLRRLESEGRVKLVSAGISINPDGLWFNLTPGADAAKDRSWLQREELRRAISYAVDRQAFVNTVFLGAATPIYGPVTPGNKEWFVPNLPTTEHDPVRAKALLALIGLTDSNGDGLLEDAHGKPATFSVLTQKGHTVLERSVAFLRDQLRQVGLTMDIVPLEQGAMLDRFFKGQYEAMYFYTQSDSFDPARSPDFWLSSGGFHVWQPNQKTPARPWEAQIDDLMRRESATIDRAAEQKLFAEVQRSMAEHLPIIYFAAPELMVAMSSRVLGATPSQFTPLVLWNPDVLSVIGGPASRQ